MSHQHETGQVPNQKISGPDHGPARSSQDLFNQHVDAYPLSAGGGRGSVAAAQNLSSPSLPNASSPSHHRIRRRNRMITSCLECRRRKLKCDKLHPCTNCAKFVRDCVFLAPALDSASQLKLTEIKEKMGVLERGLEVQVAQARKLQRLKQNEGHGSSEKEGNLGSLQQLRRGSLDLPGELPQDESEGDGIADVPEDEKGLEPTPLAVVDAAYDDDADDDMLDLGVKMGKMR